MPVISCYVSDRTLKILTEYSQRSGRDVVELAEAAISDAAIMSLPPRAPAKPILEKMEDACREPVRPY